MARRCRTVCCMLFLSVVAAGCAGTGPKADVGKPGAPLEGTSEPSTLDPASGDTAQATTDSAGERGASGEPAAMDGDAGDQERPVTPAPDAVTSEDAPSAGASSEALPAGSGEPTTDPAATGAPRGISLEEGVATATEDSGKPVGDDETAVTARDGASVSASETTSHSTHDSGEREADGVVVPEAPTRGGAPSASDQVAATSPGGIREPSRIGPPIPGRLLVVPAGPPPDFTLIVDPGSGPPVRLPIRVADRTETAELGLPVALGDGRARAVRYAPSLSFREELVAAAPDEPGFPALYFGVEVGGESWDTWLVAGGRDLSRATSRLARIEYLSELSSSELDEYEDFLRRLYRPDPKILLERQGAGGQEIFSVEVGSTVRVPGLDYEIEIVQLFNDFAIDMKTGKTFNQSEDLRNPAIQARIRRGSESRTAWLFARNPQSSRGAEDPDARLRFVYPIAGHPHPRADVTVVDASRGPLPVFLALGSEVHRGAVEPSGSLQLAGIWLRALRRIPHARIRQIATVSRNGRPAVLLGWTMARARRERWIPLDITEELRGESGIFLATLRAGAGSVEGHGDTPSVPIRGMPAGHPPLPNPHRTSPPREPRPGGLPAGHPPLGGSPSPSSHPDPSHSNDR